MRLGACGAMLVAMALPLSSLAAQARVTTAVDPARVTVGDRITLTVTVEHDRATRVEWPDSLDLTPFEVLDASALPSTSTGGLSRSTAVLTLTVFELGELEIPSFSVAVVDADGAREVLATDAWGVEIVSVGSDESGDIRDIRGPLGIPMSAWRMALWVLLPLLAAALLWFAARRLRPREDETSDSTRGPLERPAHEIALEALAALEASPMLERGQVKEYHIEVSDILRTYVERRFRVDALEMTTREVLAGLERARVDASFRDGLRAFLDQCDMVKFAKVRPDADVSRQVLELGRRLVQRSAPRADVGAPPNPLGAGGDALAPAGDPAPAHAAAEEGR